MKSSRRFFTRLAAGAIVLSVIASCGGGGSSSTADTNPDGTPVDTTSSAGPVFPLLGTPVTDAAAASRVALVAKIDNHPNSRQGSDPVGPLRSGRTQDIDILGAYNKPLFAWSGGNYRVTKAINASDLVNVGYSASRGKGGYFRSKDKKVPHNLYAKTSDLWKLAPEGSGPPQQQFTYRSASDAKPATSVAVDGAKISMYNVKVYWKWDAASGNFLRSSDNVKRVLEPHMTDDGQVNTKNVVVLYVTYIRSKADRKSPHAVTTGDGTGYVMTDGGLIPITWTRATRTEPFILKDANGAVVRLTPGRTWVELAWKNSLAQVDPGVDPAKVAWPAV